MLISIIVTGTYGQSSGSTPDGTLTFDLPYTLVDVTDSENVVPAQQIAVLNGGLLVYPLVANDSPNLLRPSQYWVTESVGGSPLSQYWVTVPAAPPGSRSVGDGVAVGKTLGSAAATFTNADIGQFVFCPAFPLGSFIQAVVDAHTVTMSESATQSASAQFVLIGASVDISAIRPI